VKCLLGVFCMVIVRYLLRSSLFQGLIGLDTQDDQFMRLQLVLATGWELSRAVNRRQYTDVDGGGRLLAW
jgi:hypothetical protein